MNEIILKKACDDILKELKSVKFDDSYVIHAAKKYSGCAYKLFNLKPHEANILKQICLSLGFDCAVSRDTVTCKCETTDCILFATDSQAEKLVSKLRSQPFRLKTVAELLNETLSRRLSPLKIKDFVFDWSRPYIAGILNVTPDSFSDGGKYNDVEFALKHAENMINDGADIIDIGGESTRPGAVVVSVSEEISRVVPVIEKMRKSGINLPVSIDTRNYETAKAAIESGADIINDVSGLSDGKLYSYVCDNNIPVIVMHSDTVPAVSFDFTSQDIVEQIYISLYKKIDKLVGAGLDKSRIIADPGIGFGKSQNANFEILKRINEFSTLDVPLLSGISRKSFIRNEFNLSCEEADLPSALFGVLLNNVNIHRVHNVKMTKKFLDYASKLK